MTELATRFLDRILTANETCPTDIRALAEHIFLRVQSKFPDAALKAVGGILFLRFICPAIVNPKFFSSEGISILSLTRQF